MEKEEEAKPVGFGKSMGVFSHKRARSTRISGSASKFDYNEKKRKQGRLELEEAQTTSNASEKQKGRQLNFGV